MPKVETRIAVKVDNVTQSDDTVTTNTSTDGESSFIGTIAGSQTNHHITPFVATAANIKFVELRASTACDLYTNDLSSGSPTQHVALAAGRPVVWNTGDAAACPITGNITAGIYVTTGVDAADLIIIIVSHIG